MKVLLTVLAVQLSLWLNTATAQITEQKLTAYDDANFDRFGISVAIDQNNVIIGADQAMSIEKHGSAYLYRIDGDSVMEVQKLTAPDGAVGDMFGNAVAINGSTLLVGAPHHNSWAGAAYVFHLDPAQGWILQAKLSVSDGTEGNQFGTSVSISGDRAVLGASGYGEGRGAVFVFTRSGSNWTQTAELTSSDAGLQDGFGSCVSISGEYAIVGAPRKNDGEMRPNVGAAYVFKRSGSNWIQHQKLTASDANLGDAFGMSVSLEGDYAIVGAYAHQNASQVETGAAYIFKRNEDTGKWDEQQILYAQDGQRWDHFGSHASISGDYAVVGAFHDDDDEKSLRDSGSAHVFKREGENWTQMEKLTASDSDTSDQFGVVSISGDCIVVGAYGRNRSTGAAYVYKGFAESNQVIGDPNGDGAINVLDMVAIANHIIGVDLLDLEQQGLADCNGDGAVNVLDMMAIANIIIGVFEECPGGGYKPEALPEVMDMFESLEAYLLPEDYEKLMSLVKKVSCPTRYHLAQNYPNPFNPTTSIQYSVIGDQSLSHTTLKIYNKLGQEVRTLVDEIQEPGYYTVTWDCKDNEGRQVASGIYFYQLTASDFSATRLMVLLK